MRKINYDAAYRAAQQQADDAQGDRVAEAWGLLAKDRWTAIPPPWAFKAAMDDAAGNGHLVRAIRKIAEQSLAVLAASGMNRAAAVSWGSAIKEAVAGHTKGRRCGLWDPG